jgi:hypothetical protein
MESGVPHIVQQEKVTNKIVSSSTAGPDMMPVFPTAPIEISAFAGAFTLSAHGNLPDKFSIPPWRSGRNTRSCNFRNTA